MFINQTIIVIFFKFLNLFALAGIAFFLFTRCIKSNLLAHITEKELEKENLRTQQLTLEKQQQELDTLLQEETMQCQDFRSKIEVWRNVVAREQEIQEKEHGDMTLVIKKRATDIALHKENERVKSIVIKTVAEDLEKSLTHTFTDPHKNAGYLTSIVQFMKENVS